MTESPTSAPKPKPAYQTIAPIDYSRIEQAMKEVGHTEVSRRTALVLVISFLLLIVIVPVVDTVHELRTKERLPDPATVEEQRARSFIGAAWAWVKGTPVTSLDLTRNPPSLNNFVYPIHDRATEERNRFVDFEKDVEKASLIRTTVQKQGQRWFTGIFGLGNQLVLVGRDDWLFFRPGIDHVAGYGFFDARQHKIRPRLHDDPLAVVVDLQRQCAAAGVTLVLLPVSDKAQLHPEQVTSRFTSKDVPRNPHDQRFLDSVAQAGVAVFDPLPTLRRVKEQRGAAFLAQDTHWTPEAMEAVASDLAGFLAGRGVAIPEENPWRESPQNVTQMGDLVGTLNLPENQRFFTPTTVTVRPVAAADGKAWKPDAQAGVVLLGDSFCNIYQDGDKEKAGGLGWGAAAGLPARLAWHLRQGIDAIAINGGEVLAARHAFAQRETPLANKKILVWQISVRDLSVSKKWELVSLAGRPRVAVSADAAVRDGATVEAELITELPGDAGDVSNYPNNVLCLVFKTGGQEFLVRAPGVIARKPQAIVGQAQPGRRFRITLSKEQPAALPEAANTWTPVGDGNRTELDDFWAAAIAPLP